MALRKPSAKRGGADEAKAKAFIGGADNSGLPDSTKPDPRATHTFKSLNLAMNEYTDTALQALADHTGRSKSNVLRHLVIERAKEEGLID